MFRAEELKEPALLVLARANQISVRSDGNAEVRGGSGAARASASHPFGVVAFARVTEALCTGAPAVCRQATGLTLLSHAQHIVAQKPKGKGKSKHEGRKRQARVTPS